MRWQVIGAAFSTVLLAVSTLAQAPANTASQSMEVTAQDSQSAPVSHDKQAKPATKEEDNSGHRYHLKLGTVTVGAGYASGPMFYPFWPYRYYPYYAEFWDPVWRPFGPYYYPVDSAWESGKGELKLKADPKDAEVYIDGAYAGTADRLKNIWLEPGAYDLSLAAGGREPYQRRIYVLTGKTLTIDAKLLSQAAPANKKEEKP